MTSKPDTKTLRQQIRFVKATDGTQLAWAQSGRGPTLVKAANWLTHLEYELRSPVWKHWLEFFSKNFRFVRYDERGCGMSGWQDGELTLDQWAADLSAVIDAAQPEGPVILLGMSQGAPICVQYALATSGACRCADPVRGLCARREQAQCRAVRSARWWISRASPGARTIPRSARSSRRGSSPAGRRSSCSGGTTCASRRRPARSLRACSRARAAVDIEACSRQVRVPTLVTARQER